MRERGGDRNTDRKMKREREILINFHTQVLNIFMCNNVVRYTRIASSRATFTKLHLSRHNFSLLPLQQLSQQKTKNWEIKSAITPGANSVQPFKGSNPR